MTEKKYNHSYEIKDRATVLSYVGLIMEYDLDGWSTAIGSVGPSGYTEAYWKRNKDDRYRGRYWNPLQNDKDLVPIIEKFKFSIVYKPSTKQWLVGHWDNSGPRWLAVSDRLNYSVVYAAAEIYLNRISVDFV